MATVIETLCIFLRRGGSFPFKKVEIENNNEYAITFSYTAMSDGKRKKATFYKENIAGISVTV